MTWRRFEGSHEQWDELIGDEAQAAVYQSAPWAQFREQSGWSVLRLTSERGTAHAQLLSRRKGPLSVFWGPGAPIGAPSATEMTDLPRIVRSLSGSKIVYIRLSDFRNFQDSSDIPYGDAVWRRPHRQFSAGVTLIRPLPMDITKLAEGYSKNWKRNLSRGLQRKLVAHAWKTPDFGEIAHLHREVATIKNGFSADWRASEKSLRTFGDCLGSRLEITAVRDNLGNLLSIRGAVCAGEFATDFLAATSVQGRKCYASNVALDHLLGSLVQREVTTFDFGGIDETANKGVSDFKHGAGGRRLIRAGEFETARPFFLASPVGSLITFRAPT